MFPRKILVLWIVFAVSRVIAQTHSCDVPDGMKKEQKLPCVRASGVLLDQPSLTPTQLVNGPDFDAREPDKSRFAYFTESDNIACYFPAALCLQASQGRQHEVSVLAHDKRWRVLQPQGRTDSSRRRESRSQDGQERGEIRCSLRTRRRKQ